MGEEEWWDPMAIEGESAMSIGDDTKAYIKEAKAEKVNQPEIRKNEMDKIAVKLLDELKVEEPWAKPPNMEADLLFAQASYSLADWIHHDVQLFLGTGIAYIVFNRPDENNSMQETLGAGITDAILGLAERPDIRVAVWTAQGRMYCAGGDPKNWQSGAASLRGEEVLTDGTNGVRVPLKPQREEVQRHMYMLVVKASKMMGEQADGGRISTAKQWDNWAKLPQFTICLINGSAMGGGVGCVCCCDYVISVKKAYIVLSEVKIGVIPATISPFVVSKLGVSNSKRFFCCAENMAAPRAQKLGIVNECVVDMKEGQERVKAMCEIISKCGPNSISAAKNLCFAVAGRQFDEGLLFETCAREAKAKDSKEAAAAAGGEASTPWVKEKIGFDVWPDIGITEKKKKA